MTDTSAPERIWAYGVVTDGSYGGYSIEPAEQDAVKYMRADLVDAMMGSVIEEAAEVARRSWEWTHSDVPADIEAEIRAFNRDATAALKRVREEARAEALREAAGIAEKWGDVQIRDAILAAIPEKD